MNSPATPSPIERPLRFVRRGEVVTLANVPPSRTLLEVLREDLGCTGTKEGCGEGDCGACTVVIGEAEGGKVRYKAVNSCIKLAHSIDGQALWTVEDIAPTLVASRAFGDAPPLAQDKGALRLRPGEAGSAAHAGDKKALPRSAVAEPALHPAQEAMVNCHGSQCGFCTPGFVMSLFGIYQNHIAPTLATSCAALPPEGAAAPADWQSQIRGPGLKGKSAPTPKNPITRELAQQELSGNLCRCTGYRPIFDAAQQMANLPAVQVDEAAVLSKLELIAPVQQGLEANLAYNSPRSLAALLAARAAQPGAQLVAGCTDVGLWVTKMHKQFGQVLDVTKVEELRRIERYGQHIAIGAAVTLSDAFAALVADRPQLQTFAHRFAGLPVRNAGTLGGNVANGSPIGDSMPLLIALGAHVVLLSVRGHRDMPLEQLYTGYRQNVMAPDEVLAWIKVPLPQRSGNPHPSPLPPAGEGERINKPTTGHGLAPSPLGGEGRGEGLPATQEQEFLRAYKISKRYDDDISAVCLVVNLQLDGGKVARIGIGAGGVAATPARAVKTEAFLRGQPWTPATVREAINTLRGEFTPLSDMRASAGYRSEVLGNLLQRFWLESQGMQQINLESFRLEEAQA